MHLTTVCTAILYHQTYLTHTRTGHPPLHTDNAGEYNNPRILRVCFLTDSDTLSLVFYVDLVNPQSLISTVSCRYRAV